ncbi:MAG: hypothetical protein LLF76_11045 [Planctomycetaceae bacterium]|nr:hypothetical protein [Planctomycetaceae bacterium]
MTFKSNLIALMLLTASILTGCSNVGSAIRAYHTAAPQVQLGMSKDHVLSILEPTQASIPLRQQKSPEQYMQNGKLVEIYFFRSYSNYDEVRTDDEFTPYVFRDGILESIGWTALGGPGTQAIPRPEQNITIID